MTRTPRRTPGPRSTLDGVRILLVEDDEAVSEALAAFLEHHGAVVVAARSVRSALDLLTEAAPDVLLSDIGRGSNPNAGFDDLARFREAGLYTGPVVFYTSRISTARRSRAVELGASIAGNESELLQAIGDQLAPSAPAGSAVA